MSDCKTCNGTGSVLHHWTETTPVCCGKPLPNGGCCNNPEPYPVPMEQEAHCPDCTTHPTGAE